MVLEMAVVIESPAHKTTYVTISKDEYESMKATIEILQDGDLMKQLKESEQAIKEGRVKNWRDFVKERKII
jgi:PHD/YefM family antitoxin component YafN of YafNO toxin-antitoxin module